MKYKYKLHQQNYKSYYIVVTNQMHLSQNTRLISRVTEKLFNIQNTA